MAVMAACEGCKEQSDSARPPPQGTAANQHPGPEVGPTASGPKGDTEKMAIGSYDN